MSPTFTCCSLLCELFSDTTTAHQNTEQHERNNDASLASQRSLSVGSSTREQVEQVVIREGVATPIDQQSDPFTLPQWWLARPPTPPPNERARVANEEERRAHGAGRPSRAERVARNIVRRVRTTLHF